MVLTNAAIDVEVVQVASGKKAFHCLMNEGADLCVVEYALPDITGVQLCTLMRQSGCETPFVFFSAMNRPIDRERAVTAKANAYLSKPEDLDIFIPTVRRLLYLGDARPADVLEFARAA